MSSEVNPAEVEMTKPHSPSTSENYGEETQHESKLIRSASESSQLAHCWEKDQTSSAEKSSSSNASCKPGFMSGSISLQEISSIMSSWYNGTSGTVTDDNVTTKAESSHPDEKDKISLSTGSASLKQHNVKIPDVVFEDKESTFDNAKTNTTHQGHSQLELDSPMDSPPNVMLTVGNDFESFFFWTPEEAKLKQVEQIGASACGATAVINIMNVLDLHPDLETVATAVQTNLRADDAPLSEYLFSRCVAGATHEALIQGLEKSTDGLVYARFFALYPKRKIHLKQWLADWMRLGAVPLATLNLQRAPVGNDIHDAWHHQMVYGVDSEGIYMCNPIIMETEEHIQPQLCSESDLLVRRFDVLKRWHKDSNLSSLALHEDPRWKAMDVLGQAVNMLLDEPPTKGSSDSIYEKELTDWFMRCHIRIPAAYKSGITLCVRKDNVEGYRRLKEACIDLPLDNSDEC